MHALTPSRRNRDHLYRSYVFITSSLSISLSLSFAICFLFFIFSTNFIADCNWLLLSPRILSRRPSCPAWRYSQPWRVTSIKLEADEIYSLHFPLYAGFCRYHGHWFLSCPAVDLLYIIVSIQVNKILKTLSTWYKIYCALFLNWWVRVWQTGTIHETFIFSSIMPQMGIFICRHVPPMCSWKPDGACLILVFSWTMSVKKEKPFVWPLNKSRTKSEEYSTCIQNMRRAHGLLF